MVAGYHGVFSVEAREEWYTMIGVTCNVSFQKGAKVKTTIGPRSYPGVHEVVGPISILQVPTRAWMNR